MDEERQQDSPWRSPEALRLHYLTQVAADSEHQIESLENRGYYSYLESGQYSDLTIVDKTGYRWAVHKIIVSQECKFFANAIKGGFKEAATNVIELPEGDPEAVRALLEYIYSKDYSIITANDLGVLMFHVRVYIIGEIYNMPCLKDLAYQRLLRLWISREGGCVVVTRIIRPIYEDTPESDRKIRDFLVDVCVAHFRCLLFQQSFADLMVEFPDFKKDIAEGLLQGHESLNYVQCPRGSSSNPT